MEKTSEEFYIGGDPPTGDFETGSTEGVREWTRSAAEKPAPIKYKLDAIDNLFAKEYFRYLDSGKSTVLSYRCQSQNWNHWQAWKLVIKLEQTSAFYRK